jgi:hypothetical protein
METHDGGGEAERALDDAAERVTDLARPLVELIRRRPGASLLVALAAGYLVGRLMR